MHNHSVLKKLLAVSAVAAMFSAFGVHAQTGGSSSASGTSQDATTQTGKTTREGTAGNTNSRGEEQRSGSSPSSSGSTSGSSQGGTTGVSDSTGAGNPNTTGKTTTEGTVGNTNSQGMEKRQGSSSGASGAAGATGSSGASGAAGTTGGSSGKLSSADEKILKDMAQVNIDEIEAAKLAQSKSQNDQVKSFAQQMIDDHTKGLNDTQQVAQQKGVTLPTEPDAKHKAMATKLQAMSGADFDKAYMSQAGVSDHKAVHSKLVSDVKKAKDPDVKALAEKLEPVVAQHLKSAQQDKSAMSGTKSGK
jgi:predicted outer membrane protein